eukprot:1047087-Prorocentrum_minimum.AAC.1
MTLHVIDSSLRKLVLRKLELFLVRLALSGSSSCEQAKGRADECSAPRATQPKRRVTPDESLKCLVRWKWIARWSNSVAVGRPESGSDGMGVR